MVIDFHTHVFPPKIAKKTIEILESNILRVYGKAEKAVIGATADELIQSMKTDGIDYSVVLPIATNTHQSDTINKYAAEINSMPELFSFGSLHPMQENWEEALYDIKAKGLLGIKLHPEYQQVFIDCPECVRVLKKCGELGLTVVLHAGRDIGTVPPVHCPPDKLRKVLDGGVNGCNIVAGHLGGWKMWDEVEKYLVGTDVFLDTAYTAGFIDNEQFIRIIRNHGSEKILFATDCPWQSQAFARQFISALPISSEEKENIFSANAKKLLQIS